MKQIILQGIETKEVRGVFMTTPRWDWLPAWCMRFRWLRKTTRLNGSELRLPQTNTTITLPAAMPGGTRFAVSCTANFDDKTPEINEALKVEICKAKERFEEMNRQVRHGR